MAHPLVQDATLIGRGTYTATFTDYWRRTVLKLTADEDSYEFMRAPECRRGDRHFPRLVRDYGVIYDDGSDVIMLVRQERLQRLPRWHRWHRLARCLSRDIEFEVVPNAPGVSRVRAELNAATRVMAEYDDRLSASIKAALSRIFDMIEQCSGGIDLSASNVMLRPANEDVVFCDPIA